MTFRDREVTDLVDALAADPRVTVHWSWTLTESDPQELP